jgi:hypothetical protein
VLENEAFELFFDREENFKQFEIPQFKELVNGAVVLLLKLYLLKVVVQIEVQVDEPF